MVKRLIWYDDRFRGRYRFKRRMLTLEEANERIHRYFTNMDILEYHGSHTSALVYCHDCSTKFWTKNTVDSYIYGSRKICENCKDKYLTNTAKMLLDSIGLHLLYIYSEKGLSRCKYKCKTCGEVSSVVLRQLKAGELRMCKACRRRNKGEHYKELLELHNKKYIKHFLYKNWTYVKYECMSCGYVGDIDSSILKSYTKINCPRCDYNDSLEEIKTLCNIEGRRLQDYKTKYNLKVLHLFCNSEVQSSKPTLKRNVLVCRQCMGKIVMGKAKEHNKHLVNEYEKILKYTLDLKNEIESQGIYLEQVKDNINYNFIKDIYEHIEGWYNNFIEIKDKYPNGDLGTVLENNPYYIHVWNIVVPVFEELLNIN